MKKFLFLLLLILSLSLISCGNDSDESKEQDGDENEDPMVGTWYLSGYCTDGEYVGVDEVDWLTKEMMYFVINSDKTGVLYGDGTGSSGQAKFTWTFADNILTMKPETDEIDEVSLIFENDTLVTQDSSEQFYFKKD